jgi:hypothetical protein
MRSRATVILGFKTRRGIGALNVGVVVTYRTHISAHMRWDHDPSPSGPVSPTIPATRSRAQGYRREGGAADVTRGHR